MLKIQHLTKQFGAVPLFTGLCMEVDAPAVLWAPSGWGKTTLLRILMGLERPTTGSVEGVGRVAAVFQEDRLLEQLDAAGNLRFALGAAYDEAAARTLLAELGLGDAGGKRVRDWSGGMKRRLALARALLAPSDALALDEPFTGLDADNRAAAQRCVARAAREKIVLLVSHEDDALTGAEVRLQ